MNVPVVFGFLKRLDPVILLKQLSPEEVRLPGSGVPQLVCLQDQAVAFAGPGSQKTRIVVKIVIKIPFSKGAKCS